MNLSRSLPMPPPGCPAPARIGWLAPVGRGQRCLLRCADRCDRRPRGAGCRCNRCAGGAGGKSGRCRENARAANARGVNRCRSYSIQYI
eukprot:scaffold46653_cov64-Phaeocystis_antarctica.AAC.4